MAAKRINTRVPEATEQKLRDYSKKFGLTMSILAGLSIQAGLDSIIRAVTPMDSITPEQMANIVIEMQKKGVDVDVLAKNKPS